MTPEVASPDAPKQRRPRLARLAALGVVVAVVVSFVVENDRSVPLRLWFVTGRPDLIWVLVVTLMVGGLVGYIVGRPGRRRRVGSGAGRNGRRRGRRGRAGDVERS